MAYVYYCDKCGLCQLRDDWDKKSLDWDICEVCKNKLKPVPDEYFEKPDFKLMLSDEMGQKLREDLVVTSPNFDQYYYDHAAEIKADKDAKWEQGLEYGKAVREGRDKGNSYGVKCPYCNATNVHKIGLGSRMLSTGLFGIGSKKIGKQWHCDHCGSDF